MSVEDHAQALTSSLQKAKLVPGSAASLIPEGFKPTAKLNIVYGEKTVDLGNLFRVTEVKLAPSITFAREVRVNCSTNNVYKIIAHNFFAFFL